MMEPSDSKIPSASQNNRKDIKTFVQQVEKISEGMLTITGRWLYVNVERADCKDITKEIYRAWASRAPTLSEVKIFLRGYFEVAKTTKFKQHQALILASELDRCDTGLPLRYQQLYFELVQYIEYCKQNISDANKELDVSCIRDAIKLNFDTFPFLDIPTPASSETTQKDNENTAPISKDNRLPPTPTETEEGSVTSGNDGGIDV